MKSIWNSHLKKQKTKKKLKRNYNIPKEIANKKSNENKL